MLRVPEGTSLLVTAAQTMGVLQIDTGTRTSHHRLQRQFPPDSLEGSWVAPITLDAGLVSITKSFAGPIFQLHPFFLISFKTLTYFQMLDFLLSTKI